MTEEVKKEKKRWGCSGIVIFAVLGIIVAGILGTEPDTDTPPTEKDYMFEVCVASEERIKSMLKSPSSAEFPSCSNGNFTRVDEKNFVFGSYVDSQNTFGAMIRSNFTCDFEIVNEERYNISCNIFD